MKRFYASCGAFVLSILLVAPVHAGQHRSSQRLGPRSSQRLGPRSSQRLGPQSSQRMQALSSQQMGRRMSAQSSQRMGPQSSQRSVYRSRYRGSRQGRALLAPIAQLPSQWPPEQSQVSNGYAPASETDVPTSETDAPTSETGDPTVETDDPTVVTDAPTVEPDVLTSEPDVPTRRAYQPGGDLEGASLARPAVASKGRGQQRLQGFSNGSPRVTGSPSHRR
jgi:hypothetical protein